MMANSRVIQVGDLTTFTTDEGEGVPVVMLHGMVATGDCWTYALAALRGKYRAIAPDMPGHGRSSGQSKPYSLGFYVRWLDGFLDALELPCVTLVGQSMGGAISLAYSMAYPAHVKRLILVDPLGVGDRLPWGALKAIGLNLPYLGMAAFSRNVDPYLLRFFQPWSFLDPWGSPREIIERMEALNHPHEMWSVWAGIRLLLVDFLTRRQRALFLARLGDIRVPTLITWGRYDGLLPVEHAYQCARRIPNAMLEIFEHSAHEPMLEQPDAFNTVICRFLSDTEAVQGNASGPFFSRQS